MPAPSFSLISQRWRVVCAGTALQLVLGTIYAWSYFQKPLMAYAGWDNRQVAWVLSLSLCFLGLSAALGGLVLDRFGPRRLAVTGSLLYGAGWALGGLALAARNLPLLYAGLGVVGGIGLGLSYVTPVATVARWFPERKGLATGMVVMGFGLGALLMSKFIAPMALAATVGASGGDDWPRCFYLLALVLGLPAALAALGLVMPPDNARRSLPGVAEAWQSGRVEVFSRRFALIWLIFFCNIVAGIMFIGFQSPMLQDLLRVANTGMSGPELAAAGATLIAASSACNGFGRLAWGAVSDRIGRVHAFRVILASQAVVFIALTQVASPPMFGLLVCYVLACYGGGFGTAPSLVATLFGAHRMAVVYGALLTAWSVAGLIGPQIVATIKDSWPQQPGFAANLVFLTGAGMLGVGLITALRLDDRPVSA